MNERRIQRPAVPVPVRRACALVAALALLLCPRADAEDAPPRAPADAVAIADAAEAAGDDARAYAELCAMRPGPALSPAVVAEVDARRDRLAARLAQTLLEQGAAQERDGQAVLAEKFYLQAVGYRATAGDALERLWATPAAVQALGGADEVARHRARLDADELQARGLRWHLRQLPRTATREELDRQVVRLERLDALAGDADGDVVSGIRLAARLGGGALPTRDAAAAARLAGLSSRILPADDAALAPLRIQEDSARHHAALARLGDRESAWTLRVGAWRAAYSASFSASATPAVTTASFTPRTASTSLSSSSTAGRVDLRFLRQPAPLGPRSGLVYGAMLSFTEASFDTSLPVADPDTGGGSLQGARFASRIGVSGIGIAAIGGWRFALGADGSPWSLQAHGLLGAHALRVTYGTRRDAVEGRTAGENASGMGVAPELGLELEASWRFAPRWATDISLGYDSLWLPKVSSSRNVTFVDSSATTTSAGRYDESLSSGRASGPVLSVGIQASF